jgi:hypothetical protein
MLLVMKRLKLVLFDEANAMLMGHACLREHREVKIRFISINQGLIIMLESFSFCFLLLFLLLYIMIFNLHDFMLLRINIIILYMLHIGNTPIDDSTEQLFN